MKAEGGATTTHLSYLHRAEFVTSMPLRGCLRLHFHFIFPGWAYRKQGVGQRLLRKLNQHRGKRLLVQGFDTSESFAKQSPFIKMELTHQSWQTPVLSPGWVGGVVAWKMTPTFSAGPGLSLGDSVCFPGLQPRGRDKSCSLSLFFPLGMGLFCLGTRPTGSPLCLITSLSVSSVPRAQF